MNRHVTQQDLVAQFTKAMEQPVDAEMTQDLLDLRQKLIMEEAAEVFDEFERPKLTPNGTIDKARLTKELADLLYVVHGAAVAFGLPLEPAFVRVHNSNMSKLGEDGKPIYRDDGKVLKGPNYKPADLTDLFE